MGFWDRFRKKESQARIALTIGQAGTAQNTPRNYLAFAKEGFQKNVVVYRCVTLISKAAAGIPWVLMKEDGSGKPQEIEGKHALKDLMNRPNPMQGRSAFMEALIGYLVLDGNTYIEAAGPSPGAPPRELWVPRADLMKVIPGLKGYPMAYQFQGPGGTRNWPVDFVDLKSPILHMKTWHPVDPWYGMSSLEAAFFQVDQQNAGANWNLALLQNQATPSGVLTVKPSDLNPSGALTTEQFKTLKDQIEDRYSGVKNAGRPMLLEGGLEWEQMSMSPKDMDYIKAKDVTSREIALAFGVPPMLLNISGDNTYANYKEARLALYEDTVLPILDFIATELNRWLSPAFGEGLILCPDYDKIEALAEKREARIAVLNGASYITQNEKRVATGYDEVEGQDVFLVGQTFYSEGVDPTETVEPDPTVETPVDPNADEEDVTATDEEDVDGSLGISKTSRVRTSIKFFNHLNENEKQKAARKQNALKELYARELDADLEDDFNELEKRLMTSLSKIDKTLFEYAAVKVIEESRPMFEKTLRKNYRKMLKGFGTLVLASSGKHLQGIETKASRKAEVRFSQWVEAYIERRGAKAVTEINGTTKKDARRVIQDLLQKHEGDPDTDLTEELQLAFDGMTKSRASLIARTETNSATNEGTREAVKALEIPGMQKEWVATIDDHTRDDSAKANHVYMNGTRIGLDEKFTVPPDTDMDGPGDPSAPPEQICNCRCALVYGVGK